MDEKQAKGFMIIDHIEPFKGTNYCAQFFIDLFN